MKTQICEGNEQLKMSKLGDMTYRVARIREQRSQKRVDVPMRFPGFLDTYYRWMRTNANLSGNQSA